MKILYLSTGVFDKGGISRYNRYQIEALRNIFGKNNIRALSLAGENNEAFEEPFNVHWQGRGIALNSKISYVWQIIYQTIVWKPKVILVGHVNYSGLAYAVSKLSGTKVILNIYGLEVWSGFSKSAIWGFKNVSYVISDCHFTANYVENEGIRVKDSTTIIWDCVNLKRFRPRLEDAISVKEKYGLPDREKHFVILTLGRLAKAAAHKGYERLLDVFENVIRKYPNARLVFGGKGDMVDDLKVIIKQKGLIGKVSFTGMVHDCDMAALYSYAHVFSLVSDRGKGRGEGIPLTPLEAMACGTPIIVGNQDGSQEAIFDDKNGYVIAPFDLKRHEAIFFKLIENPILLRELGNGAFRIAQEIFSFEKFQEKHKNFFQKKFKESVRT